MSTVVQKKFIPWQRFVFYNMDWEGYQKILSAVGERRFRHTYNNGVLEIMSPSRNHEHYKKFLGRMIETMAFELKIPIQSLGSLTMFPDEERGLEPDECYFITRELDCSENAAWNPVTDPPPDLAIEIEVSNPTAPRLPIFAKLKIPELWTYDGSDLRFLALQSDREYVPIPRSISFPFLSSTDVALYLEMLNDEDELTALCKFIERIRTLSIN